MRYKGYKKVCKKLNGVKKGYVKQLKQLPKKAKPNNNIAKMGLKAIKKIR